MRPTRRNRWTQLAGSYGGSGEYGMWSLALDAYYWDRLDEAHEQSMALGAGDGARGLFLFRMIEAEWRSRKTATVEQVEEWLSVEADAKELGVSESVLHRQILQGIDEVRQRLDWHERVPVRVTVLSEECDEPWTPGRHGFCVDKHPYDKICLPAYLTDNSAELVSAVRHEFAHVASLNLSRGRVPEWLDEAVAMLMGGELDPEAARFIVEDQGWLDPHDLNEAFHEDREDEEGREIVWMAYQQCALIGQYLAKAKGERHLGLLLASLAPTSFLRELWMRMIGRSPTEQGLLSLFGLGEVGVFDQAYEERCSRFE